MRSGCFCLRDEKPFVECDKLAVAAALERTLGTRHIHEHAPHHLRRHRQKVRPVLPAHLRSIHQSQKGFVNQCGGLKSVAGPLAAHVAVREAAQLRIDQWDQASKRFLVSSAPREQQARDVSGR